MAIPLHPIAHNTLNICYKKWVNIEQSLSRSLSVPDSKTEKQGVFEGDIMLDRRSRELVFGKEEGIAFGSTGFIDQLWPNRTVFYAMEESIRKCDISDCRPITKTAENILR